MDAYSRHKKYVNDYLRFYGGSKAAAAKPSSEPSLTDLDILRVEHRFLRSEEDNDDSTYEKRLARKYYERLFKEYAVADLSRWREQKVGLRWRTEQEVLSGKGQFSCGTLDCDAREDLRSYEVNFAYREAGEQKSALVKLRVCPSCARKLGARFTARTAAAGKRASSPQPTHPSLSQPSDAAAAREEAPPVPKRPRRPSSPAAGPAPGVAEGEVRASTEGTERTDVARELAERAAEVQDAMARERWRQRPEVERTRDDEFADYFRELFP
jgi:hypothetical protein